MYVAIDEIKWLYTYIRIYNKATIYLSELMLTPFSLFDIKCRKFNAKNLWKWKCISRASRRVSFSYFLQIELFVTKIGIGWKL